MKKILACIVVVVVAVVVWRFVAAPKAQEEIVDVPQLADDIAVYVQDQGLTQQLTVKIASLNAPGFVVALATEDGAIGQAAGSTGLLPSGKSENVILTLNDVPAERDVFYAMLYGDTNGNGVFDKDADLPLRDKADNRVYAIFTTLNAYTGKR